MASSPVVDIKSKAQFDELISKTPYVAIQAHATWCGPCKAISPIFNKLATDNASDSFTFARFDTDEVPDLSFELGIRSIPAFFSFENAEKGPGLAGASPPALKKLVEELAGKSKAEGGESAPTAPAEPATAPAPVVEEKKPEEFSTKEDF
ncbi:unnamed protein product [Clonostachys chloroleuca]|uniref:Thioredoxin domain-containing protein n=1 Tax=Clonostachys chloroleuca TaxID=1926264 RepID=A0AA35Q297_9HYPO|nr:unnamed protein product [Clonostachys chloroleuca]